MGEPTELGKHENERPYNLTVAERALMDAQGKALLVLVTALQSRGLVDRIEFGKLLGMFAVLEAENHNLQGDILAYWASLMQETF